MPITLNLKTLVIIPEFLVNANWERKPAKVVKRARDNDGNDGKLIGTPVQDITTDHWTRENTSTPWFTVQYIGTFQLR